MITNPSPRPTLKDLLDRSAEMHKHLCPRQVLGVRMGLFGGQLLDIAVPQTHKLLYTIVETDGCTADGVAVATNCWVGRRTLRIEDYGKVAATFVNTRTGHAVRILPKNSSRSLAHHFAPNAPNNWKAMLLGYQSMPNEEMFTFEPVELMIDIKEIISTPGARASCDACGEQILNGRQVQLSDKTLCRPCFGARYYRSVTGETHEPMRKASVEKLNPVP